MPHLRKQMSYNSGISAVLHISFRAYLKCSAGEFWRNSTEARYALLYEVHHDIVKVKLQSTELKSAKKPFLSGYDHSPEKAFDC